MPKRLLVSGTFFFFLRMKARLALSRGYTDSHAVRSLLILRAESEIRVWHIVV